MACPSHAGACGPRGPQEKTGGRARHTDWGVLLTGTSALPEGRRPSTSFAMPAKYGFCATNSPAAEGTRVVRSLWQGQRDFLPPRSSRLVVLARGCAGLCFWLRLGGRFFGRRFRCRLLPGYSRFRLRLTTGPLRRHSHNLSGTKSRRINNHGEGERARVRMREPVQGCARSQSWLARAGSVVARCTSPSSSQA